jgi:hypothetical protein
MNEVHASESLDCRPSEPLAVRRFPYIGRNQYAAGPVRSDCLSHRPKFVIGQRAENQVGA